MRTVFSVLLLAIATPMLSAQSQDDLLRQMMAEVQKISARMDAIEQRQSVLSAKVDLAMSNNRQFDALSSRIDAIVFEQPKTAPQSPSAWGAATQSSSAWSSSAMMSAGACANGSCGVSSGRGVFGRFLRR